jgi:hypothetical protein
MAQHQHRADAYDGLEVRFVRLRVLSVKCECRARWNEDALALHGCEFVKRICYRTSCFEFVNASVWAVMVCYDLHSGSICCVARLDISLHN